MTRKHTVKILKGGKGEGRSAELIRICAPTELPESVESFLNHIYSIYSKSIPESETEEKPIPETKG